MEWQRLPQGCCEMSLAWLATLIRVHTPYASVHQDVGSHLDDDLFQTGSGVEGSHPINYRKI